MIHFASPWAFLALAVVPLVLWGGRPRRRKASLRFSTTEHAARSGRSLKQRLLFVPTLLRGTALTLMVVAAARPQLGRERVRDVSQGIAILLVVDRSGSMAAEMSFEGGRKSRLDVVKQVCEEFVFGNGKDLGGRPNDLVGMIAFARYADTICPLTLSHGALSRFLETIQLPPPRSGEDGTAIGDAIALAAARLETAEETLARQTGRDRSDYTIEGKVIILLTDGEHNAGQRQPLEAAELAKAWDIKIHTIGVGGREGVRRVPGLFGEMLVRAGGGVDEDMLRAIAEKTGGVFRMAEDGDSLRAIYSEIDKLERSRIESVRYLDYREIFAPFALGALAMIFLEVAALSTVFRRVP